MWRNFNRFIDYFNSLLLTSFQNGPIDTHVVYGQAQCTHSEAEITNKKQS